MKTDKNKRYYTVYNRNEMTAEIFTTQIDAAKSINISPDTIQPHLRNDHSYVNKNFIICCSRGINKNDKRIEVSKRNWEKLRSRASLPPNHHPID